MLPISDRVAALRACPALLDVASHELELLAAALESEVYEVGETVCAAGKPAERVYLVAHGRLAVWLPSEKKPVRYLGSGELFGEYSLFTNQLRSSTIRADERSLLLSILLERFRSFLLANPSVTYSLLGQAVLRQLEAERRLVTYRG